MRLNTKGDTIIEVLISIAVVSLVLGGAYASSKRSLDANTRARERGEAVAFTQQQIERLRVVAKDVSKSDSLFGLSGPFCISSGLIVQSGACRTGPTGDSSRYELEIIRNNNVFTATTTWDQVGGGQEGEASITYRIYPL